ncbi:MAG: hypothetical protein ACYC42_06675 [Lysobacter sp.]
MKTLTRTAVATALAVVLAACATLSASPAATPQAVFFERLTALCGKAFTGSVAVDTPAPTGDDPFAGKALVMHVRDCSGREIRIPFHVGDDRSRTWVVTRTGSGLRLKHDHRHADGSSDAVTMYGGDTAAAGTASRQEFPVDAASQAMFAREGRTTSNTNVWAMEVEPGRAFVYELARPGGRLFRVAFDLARPVAAPPAPWGSGDRRTTHPDFVEPSPARLL